ncbi:Uncharacterized protein ToN1_03180 [Aromatoleum petrolei]|nr:Uncharacterized protein ToN1_03180 [Aromatoleum petrolei]
MRLLPPVEPSGDDLGAPDGDCHFDQDIGINQFAPNDFQNSAVVPRRYWVWRDLVLKEK